MLYFKVISLLLASILFGVRGQCPAQCSCPRPQVANCVSLALMKIPTDRLVRYVQYLDVSDNNIVSLDKTSLSDLGVISLVQFNASRNYISDIDEEAFLGHSKLQTVDLSRNSLMYIEPKTFIRNPSLDILSLSSNQYLRLPEEGPFLYSNSLRVLTLANCNLYRLPPKTFHSLPNLKELYIPHNQFETLDFIPSVGSLTFLDLRYNYLTDLQADIFTALPELMRLNLGYNNIRTLDEKVMPQLTNMSSSGDLNGNPWLCDCHMFNSIYSWCRNKSVDLELVCSDPPKFKGKQWSYYDKAGCDDFVGRVEELKMNFQELSHKPNENYAIEEASSSFEKQIQNQATDYDWTFAYVSLGLMAVFVLLVISVVILWCRFKSPQSSCKDSTIYDSV